jgi:hypothetical protein
MQSNRFNKQRIARQDNLNAFAKSKLGKAFGVVAKAVSVVDRVMNDMTGPVIESCGHLTDAEIAEAVVQAEKIGIRPLGKSVLQASRIEEATKAMVDFSKIASQLGEQPESHLQRSGTGRAGHKSAAEFFGREEWIRKFDNIEKWLRTNGGEQTVYCNSRKVRGMLTASKQVKFYVDGQQVAKSKLLGTLWPQASKQSGDAE